MTSTTRRPTTSTSPSTSPVAHQQSWAVLHLRGSAGFCTYRASCPQATCLTSQFQYLTAPLYSSTTVPFHCCYTGYQTHHTLRLTSPRLLNFRVLIVLSAASLYTILYL